jgi:hypothetical protein
VLICSTPTTVAGAQFIFALQKSIADIQASRAFFALTDRSWPSVVRLSNMRPLT